MVRELRSPRWTRGTAHGTAHSPHYKRRSTRDAVLVRNQVPAGTASPGETGGGEIDAMVHELYGLTEDEIAIVEEAIK